MTRQDLCIGTVLEERYQIERFIGAGGMGAVYAATDLKLERQVAIKVLSAATGLYAERLPIKLRKVWTDW